MNIPKVWVGELDVVVSFMRGGPPRLKREIVRVYISDGSPVFEHDTGPDAFGQSRWERMRVPGEVGGVWVSSLVEALINQRTALQDPPATTPHRPT